MALWYLCNNNERQCWEQQSILQMTEKSYLIFIYLFLYHKLPQPWVSSYPNDTLHKGPFKRFQHLLQHAFNTLLNQVSGAFEQVVQHCSKCKNMWKARWKCVESNFNWFKLSFNIASTFLLFLKTLNGIETVWTLRSSNLCPTSVQLCWTKVG